jgi:penicillin-binding protein 1A
MPRRTPLGEFLRAIEEFVRAINQTLLYYRIRTELTGEQILYLYMSQIYLGSGAYGVEAAARTYFGKSVKDLTIAECAMIAGLTKAPGRDSPKHNMKRALERRADVLRRMLEQGKITQAEYDAATHEEPVLVAERTLPYLHESGDFVEYVRKDLVNRFGEDTVYRGGLKVYTTFDPAHAQKASPNTGYPVQGAYIKRIVDKRGKVLEEHGSQRGRE